eukprot:6848531-Pyramimonas_sp.AAC.1
MERTSYRECEGRGREPAHKTLHCFAWSADGDFTLLHKTFLVCPHRARHYPREPAGRANNEHPSEIRVPALAVYGALRTIVGTNRQPSVDVQT